MSLVGQEPSRDGSELSGLRGAKLGTGPRASAVEILERKLVQIFGCFSQLTLSTPNNLNLKRFNNACENQSGMNHTIKTGTVFLFALVIVLINLPRVTRSAAIPITQTDRRRMFRRQSMRLPAELQFGFQQEISAGLRRCRYRLHCILWVLGQMRRLLPAGWRTMEASM